MKKYKELLKNIGILTLSSFGCNILSFFLVSLYTAVLSTKEYGSFDFISVTVTLLVPLLTINIAEGALRFLLDKKDEEVICWSSLRITIISIIIFLLLATINRIFNFIPVLNKYFIYFVIYYIIYCLYLYSQNITRGFDRLKNIAISGILNTFLMLILNLLFLLVLNLRLEGYFLANIIANFTSTTYLFIKLHFFKLVKQRKRNMKIENEMIKYSRPLMMNSIGWWINSASDRYIVTYICGIAANGIYSVSYKIPSVLNVIQSIFIQAWNILAVKYFDKNDKDNFISNIYSMYSFIMIISCSFLIITSKLIAKFLYLNQFYTAWKYVPFLLISNVFGAASGLLGGIFSATKDSKITGSTTIIGAIINIILNILLTIRYGIIGAATATLISYIVVWGIRVIIVRKKIALKINLKRDIIVYLMLLLQSLILLTTENNYFIYSIEFILILCELVLYNAEISLLYRKIRLKIGK